MTEKHHYIVRHTLPGRLRVIFPVLISNKSRLNDLKVSFSKKSGIVNVVTNPNSGSMTFYHETAILPQPKLLSWLDALSPLDWGLKKHPVAQSKKQVAFQKTSGPNPRKSQFINTLWELAGSFFMLVGFVGIFLPLLPTVPLILLAAFCYQKGSSKFYNWLTQFGVLGNVIRNYRDGRGLSMRTKLRVILLMWISIGISTVFFVSGLTLRRVLFLVGIGITAHILMTPTAESPTRRLSEPPALLPEQV